MKILEQENTITDIKDFTGLAQWQIGDKRGKN